MAEPNTTYSRGGSIASVALSRPPLLTPRPLFQPWRFRGWQRRSRQRSTAAATQAAPAATSDAQNRPAKGLGSHMGGGSGPAGCPAGAPVAVPALLPAQAAEPRGPCLGRGSKMRAQEAKGVLPYAKVSLGEVWPPLAACAPGLLFATPAPSPDAAASSPSGHPLPTPPHVMRRWSSRSALRKASLASTRRVSPTTRSSSP